MSIRINTECLLCQMRRNIDVAKKLGTEEQATAFAKDLMRLYPDAPEDYSSPAFVPQIEELFRKHYHVDPDRFRQEKEDSNRFVLERIDAIRERVEKAEDRVLAGLKFAILGNYIDFSALHGQVSFEKLDGMLQQAMEMELDEKTYEALRQELAKGKKLLYLTDNAGEICFDRIFAEEIARAYPNLAITFCVRGGPTLNDATREDATLAGISFPVIDNGNLVAGTQLSLLGDEAREAVEQADVLIAKGQGNVESLYGCGLNLFYAFLIKCSRFQDFFGKKQMTPMLLSERAAGKTRS